MRFFNIIYGLLWIICINTCHATEITCFSGKTRIYHGIVHDVMYNENYILFTENKSDLLILASADCILIEPLNTEQKKIISN